MLVCTSTLRYSATHVLGASDTHEDNVQVMLKVQSTLQNTLISMVQPDMCTRTHLLYMEVTEYLTAAQENCSTYGLGW